MNWEQKLAAIQSLKDASLRMREPGDWYVSTLIEIGGNGLLRGVTGNGSTPQAAVESFWREIEILAPEFFLVTNAMSERRQHWRWGGYRWLDVTPKKTATA